MNSLCILLIDDHAVFRAAFGMLLRSNMAGARVLEAGSLNEALQLTTETPDVVVLDVVLQGLNGLEGIAVLKRKWTEVPIVLLSSDKAPETVRKGLALGAAAFVSKEESAEAVMEAVGLALKPSAAGLLKQERSAEPRLTPRQFEVLDLLCQGLPNKAIGRKLGLAENTVRWHVQAVLELLQVANRSEAAFAARRRGLIR